jgi:hypothetical protein
MPSEIPVAPGILRLAVEHHWDGAPTEHATQRAWVTLAARENALIVAAGMPHQRPARIPDAVRGARVDRLWDFDVVECFVVGADGGYRELELGAGGHHLALAFAGPRVPATGVPSPGLAVAWTRNADGWHAECALPRDWLPEPIVAANAFAIGGGAFLAHRPTGGARPDFHRPAAYPSVRIPSWE